VRLLLAILILMAVVAFFHGTFKTSTKAPA
jgi:hypothetical protein